MPPKRRRLAQPISESEDDGHGSDFSDAPPPPKRAKRGKGATGKSATAKGKAKEAVPKIVPKFGLHKLPEMPLDIVFEILAFLDPVDLVHLMKVSTAFNTFLASSGAEPFWTAARRIWTFDEDELPPQPEDMAFHELIDFLFGRYCHRCLKGTTLQICFEVRARYCPPCRQILKYENPRQDDTSWVASGLRNWVGKIPLNKSIADVNIFSLMPVVSDKRYLQENLVLRAHYPIRREDLAQFLDQLRNVKPKDQPKFLKERQKYIMRRRRDEPKAFHDFYTHQLQNRAGTVKGKKEERFKSIMDKLAELGWAQEVQLMGAHTLKNFKALPCINQTRPMTDRIFKNAQPVIIEFLGNTKAARLIWERKDTLKRRLSLLLQILLTLQPWRPGLPSPYEYAMGLAECRTLMELPNDITVTKANLRALKDDGILDAFAEAQNAKSRTFFANDVRRLLEVDIPESTDPLSLAVGALFQCNAGCGTKGGWAHMRTHWCHSRDQFRTWNTNDTYAEIAVKTCGIRAWDNRLWYNFAQAIKHVVELAGLDPASATPDDMDNSPVRFACTSCDDGCNHVTVFAWIGVAGHTSHLAKVYAVTPAAAECARSLEPGVLAALNKSYKECNDRSYFCATCRMYYDRGEMKTRDAMLSHLGDRWHNNITEPKEGVDYCHVPLQDEWVYKRNWTVYLIPTKFIPGHRSYVTESHRTLCFNFEEDKPAP